MNKNNWSVVQNNTTRKLLAVPDNMIYDAIGNIKSKNILSGEWSVLDGSVTESEAKEIALGTQAGTREFYDSLYFDAAATESIKMRQMSAEKELLQKQSQRDRIDEDIKRIKARIQGIKEDLAKVKNIK